MSTVTTAEDRVAVERARLIEIVEGFDKIQATIAPLVDGLRDVATAPAAAEDVPIARESVEPRVWDLSDESLSNYDAINLVALRDDHRADRHAVDGCRVCDVLMRRLGSL